MAYTRVNWENSPSTDTPINIDNLNIMDAGIAELDTVTKYLTATAGSNGDFKVSIPNTLETGMILNITFPTATVGTANARLSINNGTTYINIKLLRGSNNIPASLIQNNKHTLWYNGTQWIVEDKLIAYITGSGILTIDNLDINADGGVYEIKSNCVTTTADSVLVRVNDIFTADYNQSIFDAAGALTATGVLTVGATYNLTNGFRLCGAINGRNSIGVGSLMLMGTEVLFESSGGHSYSGRQRYVTGSGNLNRSVSNITRLDFSGNLTTGTEIKIYKK